MKIAFVVLVCLCAGLNAFIVPGSGVSEFLEEDVALLADNGLNSDKNGNVSIATAIAKNTELLQLLLSTEYPKIMDLEIKQEYVDKKALYEHVTKKENNINERSFILIDQRFKVPVLNHFYNTQLSAQKNYGGTKNYKTFVSNVNADSEFFRHFQSPFNTHKDHVRESSVTFNDPPKRINYNTEKNTAIMNELHNLKDKVQAATKAIGHQYQDTKKKTNLNEISLKNVDRLEYLELLKYPLLRSEVKNLVDYVKASTTENSDYDNKRFRYNSKIIGPVYPTQKDTLKTFNYDFSTSFPPQRDFHKNNMAWSIKKKHSNDAVRSDEVSLRVSEGANDREPFEKYDNNKLSEKTPDEKRNINEMTTISDSEETDSRCITLGCPTTVNPPLKSNDFKCRCDAKAEEILTSDLGEIVETPVRINSDRNK